MKIIIDDLGVDCTPEDPDWRALFLAAMRKYGPASARPRGQPGWSVWKLFKLASDFVVERNKPAAQAQRRPRSQAAFFENFSEISTGLNRNKGSESRVR